MISRVKSAACLGIQAYEVDIQIDVAAGLPQMTVVGLPDVSVKESRERVKAAIKNSGFSFPPDRITINLSPADVKKEGPVFDLPIALGILAASGVIDPSCFEKWIILGELALDGSLHPFKGAMIIASSLAPSFSFLFPSQIAQEASVIQTAKIYAVSSLKEAVTFLNGESTLNPVVPSIALLDSLPKIEEDFSDVRGQCFAKRAIEIAVAGAHNLLFVGPPGSGKTMLAKRIPSILPPPSFDESLQITKIYSSAGLLNDKKPLVTSRPFRSPHHTSSAIALVGGGAWPKPGEISLAHEGVLFLDEFPEFRRDVIESLRAPLEDGVITVSRAKSQITYPCKTMLVAAMNPCPCGFLSDPKKACRCSIAQIQKYKNKISGPILDRIDLHVEVPSLSFQTLRAESTEESSSDIRERILRCRKIQEKRYRNRTYSYNDSMQAKDIKQFALPDPQGLILLEKAMKELRMSARAYFKILKISRTIADLAEEEKVQAHHIAEAIQYRSLDRQW